MKNKALLSLLIIAMAGGFSGCDLSGPVDTGILDTQERPVITQKIDDWSFNPAANQEYNRAYPSMSPLGGGMMKTATPLSATGSPNLGYAVGGAKDINNFRENIANKFLPLPSDITYEGLFYGYYFDTGAQEECTKLFCPSYSTAVSPDPLSKKNDYYLSVGLNSGIKESDFRRKKLNLVIVMDISGSMGSPFDQYYYDRFGNKIENKVGTETETKTKMEVASQSIVSLLGHLKDDDRFGLVLFDDNAYKAKPLTKVGEADMDAIKKHILDLREQGGTYMESGMEEGTKMLNEVSESDPDVYENRIIFITDAMPNIGKITEEGLGKILSENSEKRMYTTFVGVGVDFNTELVEALTKIRGANYFSVHSSKEFAKVMDEDFEYMVTPLVFDLNLKLIADGWEIEKVYGSPEADEATGEIMKVNTLFPSKTEEGETKGGLVLLKLRRTGGERGNGIEFNNEGDGKITLQVSYEDRNGIKQSDEKAIVFNQSADAGYYDNNGIRKGILLSRYADLVKSWAADEGRSHQKPDITCPPIIMYETGIRCPEMRCLPPMPPMCPILNEWERQSIPLYVSNHYKKVFSVFGEYFSNEMTAIGDKTLQQELDLLKKLAD